MTDNNKKGTIMYLSINDFFSNYIKMRNGDLGDNYQILIVSQEIIADESKRTSYGTGYISRYENIDFIPELYPMGDVLEYRFASTLEAFGERYKSQLTRTEPMKTLCAIVDLVVNEGVNIYILTSKVEKAIEYMEFMNEVMEDTFGLHMSRFEDYVEDKNSINNIGDVDNIRMMLAFQIKNLNLLDEEVGVYMNKFAKDMAKAYYDILMNKSIDELYKIGTRQNLHINKRKPKEVIVEHILKNIMEDKELPFH